MFKKYLAWYLNTYFRFLGVVFTINIGIHLAFDYPLNKVGYITALLCGAIYCSLNRDKFINKGE